MSAELVDTLLTLAEISVAFAGFSGIAAALRTRGDWHPWDLWRTGLMLVNSLGAVVLSLLPLALHHLGLSGATLWQASSLVMLLYPALFTPVALRAAPDGFVPSSLERRANPIFWGIVAVAAVAQAANAAVFGRFSLYLLGLLLSIVLASMQFAAIVVVRPED